MNETFNITDYFQLAIRTPAWLASEVVSILFITTTVWLSVSMAAYVYRTGKWKFKERDYAGGKVLLAAASVGPLALPRLILTQVLLVVGYGRSDENDVLCEYVVDSTIILFAIGVLPPYLYLWLRQRTFYLQPSLARLYTKRVKVLSWGCLFFMLVTGAGIVVLFIYPLAYRSSDVGCIFRDNVDLPFYATATTMFVSQCVLVGLFVYPLFVHNRVQVHRVEKIPQIKIDECPTNSRVNQTHIMTSPSHDVTCGSHSDVSATATGMSGVKSVRRRKRPRSDAGSSVQGCRVLKAIQRSVVCSAVCVLSDFVAFATITYILPSTAPKGFTNVVYDFSLWMNLLSVIFSFETYKNILLPC